MVKHSTSQRSPLSPTRWPPEAFAWQRTLGFLLLLLIGVGLGFLVDFIVTVQLGTPLRGAATTKLTWGIAIGQLAFYVPVLVVTLPLLPWLAGRTLAELGLRWLNVHTLFTALGGAVAMYAAATLAAGIQYAFTHVEPQEAAVSLFTSTKSPALIAVFAAIAVVVAPFVEELIFRGFLFNALLRYTPAWLAAAVSGLLFGLFHMSPSAFVPLACSGIVLAYVYYLSGSLVASMLTHALFNAINIGALASTGHP